MDLFLNSTVALECALITAECKTDGSEGAPVFGLKGASAKDTLVIPDVSCNRKVVERLIHLLNKGKVSSDQLLYIIEDYIAVN